MLGVRTSTSGAPYRVRTASRLGVSVTSTPSDSAVAWFSRTASAVAAAPAVFTSVHTTIAPKSARPNAHARPIPRAAPMTTAVRPSTRNRLEPVFMPRPMYYQTGNSFCAGTTLDLLRSEEHTSELQSQFHL